MGRRCLKKGFVFMRQSNHGVEATHDVVFDIIMIRIVLDTDVMVAAFHGASGASRALLLEMLGGEARPLLSTPAMIECEAVLTRPEKLTTFGIGAADLFAVPDELAAVCIPVAFDCRWRPGAAGPDDGPVPETAINGNADVIARSHLADLMDGAVPFGIAVEGPNDVSSRLRP